MLASWHWHIEISSKCTLRCPRCARSEVPNTLVNTELDLSFFEKNFTKSFIDQNVEKITFCGDDGDPIYAHDLIDVIKHFKKVKPVEFVIVTNGSHKKDLWWEQLALVLDHNDSIHFSLDGWDDESNSIYRIGSSFTSAINGIKILRQHSQCKLIWDAIAFKFNEDKVDYMRSIAKDLGMDRFQLTKSTKFGSVYPSYGDHDPLQPSSRYISSTQRFEREFTYFTDKKDTVSETNIKLYVKHKDKDTIVPLCYIGNKGLYIDSRGRLFPCCWVANRYTHNSEWQNIAETFNLHNITIEQALKDDFWTSEFQTFKWQECQSKCNKRVINQEYATSW